MGDRVAKVVAAATLMETLSPTIAPIPPADRISRGWPRVLFPGWLISLATILLGSLALRVVAWDAPREVFPGPSILLLWAVPLWLASRLRNPYSKALVAIWIVWFGVGSCNLVASYLSYGDFYLVRADPAAIVYEAGVAVMVLALLSAESLLRRRNDSRSIPSVGTGRVRDLPPLFFIFLLLFPLAYLVSMLVTVGYLPILQGRSFVDEIYDTDYGPLYGYGTVLVFSLLAVLHRAVLARRTIVRIGWVALALLFLFIAVADGKRFYAMIVLLAIYPLYSLRTGLASQARPRVGKAALALGLGGLIYLGVLVIRSGHQLDLSALLPYALSAVGVEYRDFAYSMNHVSPGSVPGYDWLRSTCASLLNSQLLAAVGIDKAAETLKGSAYVWRDLFGSVFGIRTGIISELYFAFGVSGALVLYLLGLVIGVVTKQLVAARQGPTGPFWAVLYAIAVLTIVGQSTSTAGLITLVAYVYCVYWVLSRVTMAARRASPPDE